MKVALIDMDYTLVDIAKPDLFENLVKSILQEKFSRTVTKEQAHEIVRGNSKYLAEAGINDAFWKRFDLETPLARLRAIQNRTMRAMLDAHRLLSELEVREYYIALVTNAPESSARVALDYLWLAGYFSAFSFSEGKLVKPHEEPALRALRGAHNIESIFFLGDSGYDIGCGKRLSTAIGIPVTTIYLEHGKTGNPHGADFVVTKLDEVLELLEKGKI